MKFSKAIFKSLFKGLISFVPGSNYLFNKRSGRPVHPSYYIYVFLLHQYYSSSHQNTFGYLEIGPGECPGLALIAYCVGYSPVSALDVLPFASNISLLHVAKGLKTFLLTTDTLISNSVYKNIFPLVPLAELNQLYQSLLKNLDFRKLDQFCDSSLNLSDLNYYPYLSDPSRLKNLFKYSTYDFVVSQACLEHVVNLESLFSTLRDITTLNSTHSHSIDLSSHGITNSVDGHRGIHPFLWYLLKGRRSYFINRLSYQDFALFFEDFGFTIEMSQFNEENCNAYFSLKR